MIDYPVPKRMAPRQRPGVYIILCIKNNKRYYGESVNVSARLSQHKSRLRRNIHEIPELQHDWNLYGEIFFDFSAVYMCLNCDRAERKAIELKYISQQLAVCYNKFAQTSRKKQNNPFWGKKHTEQTKKQISRSLYENYQNRVPEGIQVLLNNQIYPSISEASRQTTHSRDTIRRWLNDPKNKNCQKLIENNREPNIIVKNNQKKRGLAKPISLDGTKYQSISDASKKLNCSRANIQRRLKTDKKNCFFL